MTDHSILHSDCLDALARMDPSSADSFVTDPPYELSDSSKASPARILAEALLPKNPKVVAEPPGKCMLLDLATKVSDLCRPGNVPGPAPAMPEVAVALHDDATHRQDNVENSGPLPGDGIAHPDRGVDLEADGPEYAGSFELECADVESFIDAASRVGACFLSGGLGVGFRVASAGFPGLEAGGAPVVDCNHVVGLFHDALASRVGADGGAEDLAVPRIALAGGSVSLLPARPALLLLAFFEHAGAKLVRTIPAAGGLPPVPEPDYARYVVATAHGTIAFDLRTHGKSVASTGFMGKAWDGSKVAFDPAVWREALRVAKPGAHLVAFGGTRTYHRLTCAIEDAGWEIRDCLMWLYGEGFPKSRDVSKGIDAIERGAMVRRKLFHFMKARGHTPRTLAAQMGLASAASIGDWTVGGHTPSDANYKLVLEALEVTPDEEAEFEREVIGTREKRESFGQDFVGGHDYPMTQIDITTPATDAAKQWDGWGTALKPAWEPIILARKPLEGTVAENVQRWGTGGLNIDACRIGEERRHNGSASSNDVFGQFEGTESAGRECTGRWPANLILSHAAECGDTCADGCPVAMLDAQSGDLKQRGNVGASTGKGGTSSSYDMGETPSGAEYNQGDSGGASRFFYIAKASRAEREAGCQELTVHPDTGRRNSHPTVKPVSLMAWLCRLVTPPGGIICDPFAGSGSTGCGAVTEGFRFLGIEKDEKSVAIARARVAWWAKHGSMALEAAAREEARLQDDATSGQMGLFK